MAEWQESYRAVVFPWHCDHYGHMNVRWYAHHFDDAGFHIWSLIGCPQAAIRARGIGIVVASIKIDYIREMGPGDMLVIKSGFIRVGNKSTTHFGRMYNADTGELCATQEAVEVFFDTEARKSAPMPDDVRAILTANLVSLDDGG